MNRTEWACLGLFIVGFLLFAYGANIYSASVGYTGLYLVIGAVVAYILLYAYKKLTITLQDLKLHKPKSCQR